MAGDAEAKLDATREWMLAHLVRRWRVRHAKEHGAGRLAGTNFVASRITSRAIGYDDWTWLPYTHTRLESHWVAPNARVAGLHESRARAWSAVLNLGGLHATRKLQRRAGQNKKRTGLVQLQQQRFMLWWLDSQPPAPVGPIIRINVGRPCAQIRRRRQREAARQAALRPLHRGLEGDRCNRWAIEELMDGRMVGRAKQVKVKWKGHDSDGEPWEPEWVKWTDLTKDMKQLAWQYSSR